MLSRRSIAITAGVSAAAAAAGVLLAGSADHDAATASLWSHRDTQRLPGLVHYATLAANSHNAQAWRFRPTDRGVAILPDLTRALPVADSDHHHLYASLGCAAENLMLAAGAAGQSSASTFVDEGEGRVEIATGLAGAQDPLFDAILLRQCTRSLYDGRAISAADRVALVANARVEGAEVILIEDRARIDAVLELILAANAVQVADPAFGAELVSWLRFNARAAIKTGDGLYAAASGSPTVPAVLGRMLFNWFFRPASENDRYAAQVRSSSGLAVIVSDRDDRAHWFSAGRCYQRFALQSTLLGIRHAHLNQPVEVASVRPQLQALLGLGQRRPDLVLRYGHAPAMPRSLRRPVEAVIVA